MTIRRLLPICLSVVIVLAGMWLVIVAQDATTGGSTPIIVTTSPNTDSPGTIDGIAGSPDGGEVVVTATIDGEEIPGSPDATMEGENNEFHFEVPPGNQGKEVKIQATAPDGTVTTRYVPINP